MSNGLVVAAPCRLCPFRRDVPIYLRLGRRREIAMGLMRDGEEFQCHETVTLDEDDGEPTRSSAERVCAGASKMIDAAGGSTQLMRIAENLGDVKTYDRGAAVWTLDEFTSLKEGSVEGNLIEDEDAAEVRTCSVVEAGCLAPAGYAGLGGGAIEGFESADEECAECGEPVCSNCITEDGLCNWCSPEEDD